MFESLTAAPPDAILGLNEAYAQDKSEHKINLGVGVYKDPSGITPVLECVKAAEHRIIESENSKAYLAISGRVDYAQFVPKLLFGNTLPEDRVGTIQSPGGTGALRVAADFIRKLYPKSQIWLSRPTWANHPNVFTAASVPIETYAYYDPTTKGLNFEAMMNDLKQVAVGDVVLLHGCCHNPTGVDLSAEQWLQIGQLLAERKALPLVDFAYQGFADGLEEDATGLRSLLNHHDEILVCSSFSKNFGLYRERVGALVAVGKDENARNVVMSQLKKVVRTNYSNPPSHGAAIVATVLADDSLTKQWHEELAGMRQRINGMRELFVAKLKAAGVDEDYGFIQNQRGMFSYSGLSKEQVDRLRKEYSIYIVDSGRINVAGITESNVGHLCESIAAVL